MKQDQAVTSHRGNFLNDNIEITALGEPGAGGAYLEYEVAPMVSVALTDEQKERLEISERKVPHGSTFVITFQQGDPADGIVGASNEALMAVLIHRMEGFQEGPFKCMENVAILECLKEAMYIAKARTKARVSRGVEGKPVQ